MGEILIVYINYSTVLLSYGKTRIGTEFIDILGLQEICMVPTLIRGGTAGSTHMYYTLTNTSPRQVPVCVPMIGGHLVAEFNAEGFADDYQLRWPLFKIAKTSLSALL